MLGGMPGMDPRQMAQMMKQMGIQTDEINAKRVIIETDKGNLILPEPQVTLMSVQGQKIFQVIAGEIQEEESVEEIPAEDIKMVAEQAKVSEDEAKTALESHKGDIAEAIMSLQK